MTKSVITKSTEPESKDAPDVTVDSRLWMPKECPKCQRLLKTKKGYDRHIKACKKEPSKPRVVLTDEEKAAKRKGYVQAWVDKNQTIQIRLLKDSDELAFVTDRVDELREDNEKAGMATYFMGLLTADIKKYQRKAAKAAK